MLLFYCAIQRTQIRSWVTTTSDLLNLGAFTKITKSINHSFVEAPTHLSSNYKISVFPELCMPCMCSKLSLQVITIQNSSAKKKKRKSRK